MSLIGQLDCLFCIFWFGNIKNEIKELKDNGTITEPWRRQDTFLICSLNWQRKEWEVTTKGGNMRPLRGSLDPWSHEKAPPEAAQTQNGKVIGCRSVAALKVRVESMALPFLTTQAWASFRMDEDVSSIWIKVGWLSGQVCQSWPWFVPIVFRSYYPLSCPKVSSCGWWSIWSPWYKSINV